MWVPIVFGAAPILGIAASVGIPAFLSTTTEPVVLTQSRVVSTKLSAPVEKLESIGANQPKPSQAGQDVINDQQHNPALNNNAPEQFTVDAQYLLGLMYEEGLGVPKDDQKAVASYRKAAEQGLADAQFKLAYFYATGQGVKKDVQQALAWYRKAAEQGLAGAQYSLARMYALGKDTPKDDKKAIEWFRKAAEQGNAAAQSYLGLMYAKGVGEPKDEQSAYFWWLLASANGSQGAVQARDAVERELSQEQRAAAQTAARNWRPMLGTAAVPPAPIVQAVTTP